jgi:hypothetical protein
VDSAGSVFFTENGRGGRIRKVTTDGRITNVVGNGEIGEFSGEGGPATVASLTDITGLSIDADGNLIVSIADRVVKVFGAAAPGLVGGVSLAWGDGDVNGDGHVNVQDVVLTLRSLVGLITLTQAQSRAADMNRDGQVRITDVNALLRRSLGLD